MLSLFLSYCFGVLHQRPVVSNLATIIAVDGDILPSARLKSAPYPEWAHHHQVWLASGDQNQTAGART
jgi:hypothetical protein